MRARFTCWAGNNISVGRWYPVWLLPNIQMCWNRALRSFHIELVWLCWECHLNFFAKERP